VKELGLEQIEQADSRVELVLEKITDAVITGHFKPGTKLVEARLANQLGVSRGPVREAIRRLEQVGVVERIPYRGAFVSSLTERDIQELHGVRWALESLGARILTETRDEGKFSKLEIILDNMREAAQEGDQAMVVALDAEFHDTLIELSENKLLGEVWATVSVHVQRFLYLRRERRYQMLEDAVKVHEPILKAMRSGNVQLVEEELRKHIPASVKLLGEWENDDFK